MANPFKPDDKVLILRKGLEIEATVRTTFNHEVQVRTADGELLWRTVNTVRSADAPGEGQPEAQTQKPESHSEIVVDHPHEESPAPVETIPVETTPVETVKVETAPVETAVEKPEASQSLDQPAEPQPQKPEKGSRKSKKSGKGFLRKFLADDSYDE